MTGATDLTAPDTDERLNDLAVGYVRSNPFRTFVRAVRKVVLFFSPVPLPWREAEIVSDGAGVTVQSSRLRNRLVLLLGTVHGIVLLTGVWALFRFGGAARPASARARLLFGAATLAVLLAATHAVTFPETRYRLPIDPLLMTLAAVGFTAWARHSVRSASAERSTGR